MSEIKNIEIICIANYCRSPVAEKILSHSRNKNFIFSSSGLNPIPKPFMDPRSQKFLKEKGIDNVFHNPRLITKSILSNSDILLAMDLKILNVLNHKFPEYRKKFKIFSYQEPNIDLSDPFNYRNDEYIEVMNNINKLCDTFFARFDFK